MRERERERESVISNFTKNLQLARQKSSVSIWHQKTDQPAIDRPSGMFASITGCFMVLSSFLILCGKQT